MTKFKGLIAAIAMATSMAVAGGAVAPVAVVEVEPALTGFYLGGSYAYADNEVTARYVEEGIEGTNNSFGLIAGYNVNEYFAVEGRYSFLAEDDYAFRQANVVVENVGEVDGSVWAIFLKPQYPVTPEFKVYGLLGYGETTLTADEDIVSEEGAFQYGLGGAYSVTRNVEVFADWTRALDDEFATDGFDLEGVSDLYTVGVNYKF